MSTLNVSIRRRPDMTTAVRLAALLAASLSLTGCAALQAGGRQQAGCRDGACSDAAVGVDLTCEAPMPIEPIDIVACPFDGCAAPAGCAPLTGPSATVPPEMPYMAAEEMQANDSIPSQEPMISAPDAISSMSGTDHRETAIPLTIPQHPHPDDPHAQQDPAYQAPQYQEPQSPYPAAGMSAGPAPIAQCAPCQECLRLRDETTELQEEVAGMRESLQNEREVRTQLEDSLSVIRQQLSRISDDVRYWQSEVRRIDEEAEQQHKEDLKSLEMLSDLVTRLPRREKLPDVDVSIIEE